MSLSTLNKLAELLGDKFHMSALDDYIIEDIWLENRLLTAKRTSARRELSSIRYFVEWAAKRNRNSFQQNSPLRFLLRDSIMNISLKEA